MSTLLFIAGHSVALWPIIRTETAIRGTAFDNPIRLSIGCELATLREPGAYLAALRLKQQSPER
jgi:hypothetical protein